MADLGGHMGIRFDVPRHILSLTDGSELTNGNLDLADFTESDNEGIRKSPAR